MRILRQAQDERIGWPLVIFTPFVVSLSNHILKWLLVD